MYRARTPQAAAIAGVLYGILFSSCIVLMGLATTPNITNLNAWTKTTRLTSRLLVSISLALISLAGVAFLWFIGVARDRLGAYEDQFFATVFQGSGLLLLAMTFSALAFAAAMFAALPIGGDQITERSAYVVEGVIMSQMFNMHALKWHRSTPRTHNPQPQEQLAPGSSRTLRPAHL